MSPIPVFVFDTCIWIDLTEESKFAPALDQLLEAIDEGELRVAVPEGVEREWGSPGKAKLARERRAKSVRKHAAELRRVSAELGSDFRSQLESTLDGLDHELEKHAGTLRTRIDQVHEIWSHASTLKIPFSDSVKLQAAELALAKKAPFHRGNSMMDALILLSTFEYSKRSEAPRLIHFCTKNSKDFSSTKDQRQPHPDLAELFGEEFRYSYGVEYVLKEIGASAEMVRRARWDDSPGTCIFCNGATLIESAVCARCEMSYEGPLPDSEHSFRIESTAEGDTIVEYSEDPRGRFHEEQVLVCEECGHNKFDLEFERLCPYHQHMSSRWQAE